MRRPGVRTAYLKVRLPFLGIHVAQFQAATKKQNLREKLLRWLAPCNVSLAHLSAYNKHELGTGKWFLQGSWFADWRSSNSPNLWLVGSGRLKMYNTFVVKKLINSSWLWKDRFMVRVNEVTYRIF